MTIIQSRIRMSVVLLVSIATLGLVSGCGAAGVPPSNVTTLAGSTAGFADGSDTTAQFNGPTGVAVAPDGTVYIADTNNHRIRATNPTTGQVTTLAGTGIVGHADGPGDTAKCAVRFGVGVAPSGAAYVADTNNHLRRRLLHPSEPGHQSDHRLGYHTRRQRLRLC